MLASTEDTTRSSHRAFELAAHELQELLPAPPIDRDQLCDRCLGNLDFGLMLLDEFEKEHQSRLDALDAALAERRQDDIASQAHALKGVAAVLAANTLMKTCANLESAAKNTDWDQTHALIQHLHHEMRRTIEFIPNIQARA